ncbi:hypothetical protein VTJ04DRAFT_2536 [Mycothermus thermophilus]|uniref:uncharacterized protein n=1 Tax=Humicola insolens TaxID=85995 RepID=UPI0037431C0E
MSVWMVLERWWFESFFPSRSNSLTISRRSGVRLIIIIMHTTTIGCWVVAALVERDQVVDGSAAGCDVSGVYLRWGRRKTRMEDGFEAVIIPFFTGEEGEKNVLEGRER